MPAPADRAIAPVGESTGLTQAEAARRLADTGPDEVAARKPVRLHKLVLAQLTDPLIMVLLGAVVLTLAIGDHPDAIVIGPVVLVNTTVGVAQEIRADNAVAALTAPHARVRRDGAVRDVPAASLGAGLAARALDLPWQRVLFLALLAAQLGVVLGLAPDS
ncbi:hypothetical protein EAO70_16660 [Streptomyces sp. adm13(2018)]|uniref:cation-transporting P-type ATPase n=1 Tax=Streptomyces sp. B6(2022) TaxID=3404749 RepID=UPI0011CD8E17|nr:hypothetical protein EAO70_16660 [Streptomyces sp. adm13(2018)]